MRALTISFLAVYSLVMLLICVYGMHRILLLCLYYSSKSRQAKPRGRFQSLPPVTVQLPLFNEKYVVERLIDAVVRLDYPKDRLEIQVLDDSTDDTVDIASRCVKRYQDLGYDIQYLHRANREGFKAGALEAGIKVAKGAFIAIFDADFIPRPGMLLDCIHFFTDPRVGMVQTRWGHLNPSHNMITRTQAMLLDGHFVIEHSARNRTGRFMNFNGTAGVWRRETVIDAGGWQHDTLTEDLDLSYRAQMRGWRFVFAPDLVSPAELPVEMNAFKTQQHRWTKGQVQTAKKLLPKILKSDLSWKVKLEAFFHLTCSTVYIYVVVMTLLLLPALYARFEVKFWESWQLLVFFHIPFFICASLSASVFYVLTQREINRRGWLRSILMLPVLMAVGIGISLVNAKGVIEAFFNWPSGFIRTPKYGVDAANRSWRGKMYRGSRNFLPILELIIAVYLSGVVCVAVAWGLWSMVPFLIMFQLGYFYVGLMSIFQGKKAVPVPSVAAAGLLLLALLLI